MSFKSFADKLRNKLLNCLYQLIASLKGRNNLLSNKDLKNLKMTLNHLCGLNLFTAFTSCFATYVLF